MLKGKKNKTFCVELNTNLKTESKFKHWFILRSASCVFNNISTSTLTIQKSAMCNMYMLIGLTAFHRTRARRCALLIHQRWYIHARPTSSCTFVYHGCIFKNVDHARPTSSCTFLYHGCTFRNVGMVHTSSSTFHFSRGRPILLVFLRMC